MVWGGTITFKFMSGERNFLTGLVLIVGCLGTAWAEEGAEYSRIISTGEAAPRGETYGTLTQGALGSDSTLGVFGSVLGTESNRVWVGKDGTFSVVAAEGEAAPGGGGTFAQFGGLSINGVGETAFFSRSNDVSFETEYFAVENGGLVPALPGQAPFAEFPQFALASGGTAEYAAGNFLAVKLGLEGVNEQFMTVLATGEPGNLKATFAEGQPAPVGAGLPPDLTFGRIFGDGFDSFNDPGPFLGINDSKEIIFVAEVFANSGDLNRLVVYAGPVSAPRIVAVTQQLAPGTGDGFYSSFGSPSISSNGLIAFSAGFFGSDSSGAAIFLGTPEGVVPVVKRDDQVPGGDEGVLFGNFGSLAVNARGDIVFWAQIVYPNELRRPSVWLKRAGEDPVLLAATGNVFKTPDGPAEVTGLEFKGEGAFNDLNQVAFVLSFGDRDGLYLADVRSGYPVVSITSPAQRSDQVTTRAATVIAGTATDATGVREVDVVVTGRTVAKSGKNGEKRRRGRRKQVARALEVSADNTWSFRAPLEMGNNRISVTATDLLGNVSPSTDFTVIRYQKARGAKGRKLFRKLKRRVILAR